MDRIEVVATILSSALFLVIVELVRRKALREQYALLWLLTSVVLIGLSLWRGALHIVARLFGIYYAPSVLLLIGLGFTLVILLHYSVIISKLAEQNKILAQHDGMMAASLRKLATELDATAALESPHQGLAVRLDAIQNGYDGSASRSEQ